MIPKPQVITDLIIQGTTSGGSMSIPASMAGVASKPNKKLEALDASVTLNIDGASSSATIRLPRGTKIDGRCYVEMFTIQGSAGVFRTRSPQIGYGMASTQIQLEHAVNEIGDFIVTDKIEKQMTLKKAMQTIFSYYTPKSMLWQLGTVETPVDPESDEDSSPNCVLEADYVNCLEAIQGVMEQFPYMYLDFSFASRPWKLNVRNKPTKVDAEGRISRNVKSALVTRDDSQLFTRVYMAGYKGKDGKPGFYTSSPGVKKYGLIETVITGANDTPEIAERTVKNFMHTHKKPRYNITIDGTELSEITGEKLDRFTIGKLLRLALPDYNETVTQNITGLSFAAIYTNPTSVTVVLNDEADKVIKYIKDNEKAAKKLGKKAVTKASVKGGTLTLTQGDGTEINFSKAVILYKDKAHDAGWNSGKFTVRAYVRNIENGAPVEKEMSNISTTLKGIVPNGDPYISGKNIIVPLKVTCDQNLNTGLSTRLTVDGSKLYNNGWNAAAAMVKYDKDESTAAQARVYFPSTVDAQGLIYYYPDADNDYCYVRYNSASGVKVARRSHDAYKNGRNAVNIEAPTWSAGATTSSNVATFKTDAPTPKERKLSVQLVQSSDTVYLQARNGTSGSWVNYAKLTPTLDWSLPSSLSHGSSNPSGSFAGSYSVPKSDSYIWFTITVNGESKRIKIHLTT